MSGNHALIINCMMMVSLMKNILSRKGTNAYSPYSRQDLGWTGSQVTMSGYGAMNYAAHYVDAT